MSIFIPEWIFLALQIAGGMGITLLTLWLASIMPSEYAGIVFIAFMYTARHAPAWMFIAMVTLMIIVTLWAIISTPKKPLD